MEILDLYDINGNKLNKTIVRGNKPSEGEFIKLTIVYLKSQDKYLVQQCSVEKGGEYAITGGHVTSGISSKDQAIVECQEELGITLDISKLSYLGNIIKKSAIFDVYLYEDDSLINFNFTLQPEEVESVHWLTKSEFENLIQLGVVRPSSCEHYNKFIR